MKRPFRFPNHVFIIAEAGINHNGDIDIAKQLVDAAVEAGADAIKFQKRTPRLSLPPHLWEQERDTPWGERMTYIKYREKIELSNNDYLILKQYCEDLDIVMFASPWDFHAANTLQAMDFPLFKIASASLTNLELVEQIAKFGKPVIASTGMCSQKEIEDAAIILLKYAPEVALLACTSTYPARSEDLHLNRIHALGSLFPAARVGYSGHETGLWTTVAAVAMGARVIERHLTLDRSMKGTDQAASVEPAGFKRLVREIRNVEKALGDDVLRLLPCEEVTAKRLRG